MAEGTGSRAEADDLPDAREAFSTDEPGRRETDPYLAARAGALLVLVPPRGSRPADDGLADQEARELLGVVPVAEFDVDRAHAISVLTDLGETGSRVARLFSTPSGAREPPGTTEPLELVQDLFARSTTERASVHAAQREAATELFGEGRERGNGQTSSDTATRLIVASLLDEEALVRVAASAAALRIDPRNRVADSILEAASRASDEIGEFARAILINARGSDQRRLEIEGSEAPTEAKPDSVLVHGTWARRGRWWRPSGELHEFLRNKNVFPLLYAGRESFAWSGYFSVRTWVNPQKDWDREQAGSHLAWWAERRLTPPPDMIGHSYGGSISMLATQVEKKVRGLLLLSPAVHRACLPDPDFYEGILLVRMRLDLVLLADRSKPQLLRELPRVTERILPRRGKTGHFETHDPTTWAANSLDEFVRDEWLVSLGDRS
jgi:pimeloyl-ACP methyl ester carboxylesterase